MLAWKHVGKRGVPVIDTSIRMLCPLMACMTMSKMNADSPAGSSEAHALSLEVLSCWLRETAGSLMVTPHVQYLQVNWHHTCAQPCDLSP